MPAKTARATKAAKTSAAKPKKPAAAKPTAPPRRAQPLKVTARPAVKTASMSKPAAAPVPGAYVLEEQIGFRIRKAHQRASQIFADIMAEFDVTPTQFAALAKLDELGAISQNQLGRLTAMDPATILGVVGRLYRQNWLRSRPAEDDARLMLIELTGEGALRIKHMKEKAARVTKQTLAPLSPDDAATLNRLLARIG